MSDEEMDPLYGFKFEIEAAPIQAKARKLKSDWGPPGLKERSAVDRLGALGDGEPDPGPKLPNTPEEDLRDLWGTDPAADLINNALEEIEAAGQEAVDVYLNGKKLVIESIESKINYETGEFSIDWDTPADGVGDPIEARYLNQEASAVDQLGDAAVSADERKKRVEAREKLGVWTPEKDAQT
jgi:hypothetical protein